MKLKFSTLSAIYIALLIGSIIFLFSVKSRVIEKNKELTRMQKQISQEENDILVLKTELAYLLTPERINALQAKHLHLINISKDQLEKFDGK
ncbi:cell division protein FtsL [Candidatus Bandiella euplotis]|uniref:Cell division protein FtsL n=1 Tax=Candidatus Bandiella euplotis TaxID=1664265 RepID=A0ABZ0UQS8_9RICK|nr:hypothetical protein [Candidatus Bandiella woodruffii]WPX97063.1 hypothetical protein Bandiella_01204 [Candidatus Bandiella woodruffii]